MGDSYNFFQQHFKLPLGFFDTIATHSTRPALLGLDLAYLLLSTCQVAITYWFMNFVLPCPVMLTSWQFIQGLVMSRILGEFNRVCVTRSSSSFSLAQIDKTLLWKLSIPAACCGVMLLASNNILCEIKTLSLFPAVSSLPFIVFHLLSSYSLSGSVTPIIWYSTGFVVISFGLGVAGYMDSMYPILIHGIASVLYRGYLLNYSIYVTKGSIQACHNHIHFIAGLGLFISLFIFSEEPARFVQATNSRGAFYIVGCLTTIAAIPFAKNLSASLLIRQTGRYTWQFLECICVAMIFFTGLALDGALGADVWVSVGCLLAGRMLLVQENVYEGGDTLDLTKQDRQMLPDIPVAQEFQNPHFLCDNLGLDTDSMEEIPYISHIDSTESPNDTCLPADSVDTLKSRSLMGQIAFITKAYVTREFVEDVEALHAFGGPEKLEEVLSTNLKEGIKADSMALSERKINFGINELPKKEPTPFIELCLDAANEFTLKVLMLCGIISVGLNLLFGKNPKVDWIEGFAIWVAVIIVVLVTAINDKMKEKQFEKLTQMKDDKLCSVIRDGSRHQIGINQLVVGDLVIIEAGDELPADGILIQGRDLKIDESSVTGEACHVRKSPHNVCMEQSSAYQSADRGGRERLVDSSIMLSGTTASSGSGTMLAVAVGEASQTGQLYQKLAFDAQPTPLQSKLNAVATDIGNFGFYCACLTLLILLAQFWGFYCWQSYEARPDLLEIVQEHVHFFVTAVTILVVAVPEGLPLAVTISLAYSIGQMLKDKNYVRRLAACETMGGANQICSDKTGTLTTNRMVVQAFWDGEKVSTSDVDTLGLLTGAGESYLNLLCDGIALNSSAFLESESINVGCGSNEERKVIKYVGSPTDCALLNFCNSQHRDYEEIRKRKGSPEDIIDRIDFSSERKMMSTVASHRMADGRIVYRSFVKGAAEIVMKKCTHRIDPSMKVTVFDESEKSRLEQTVINTMALSALRTICLAYKDSEASTAPSSTVGSERFSEDLHVNELTCIGIAGIRDPIREEVPEAVLKCQLAGIKVRMVTGDNLNTATQIARQSNILQDDKGIAMLGSEFYEKIGGLVCAYHRTEKCSCCTDEKTARARGAKVREDVVGNLSEFKRIMEKVDVLARSQPNDKYALVTGLRQLGCVVAVTGDGINDAAALKKADVGFAMGIAGKEVAKHAADIVILDDNFSSIVQAVKWGRNVYDNIRKFLQFQLTVNVVAVFSSFFFAIFARQTLLDAVQMLWINLIMDSFASLALATEKPTDELLERQPHSRKEYLISKYMTRHIFVQAIYQFTVLVIVFFFAEYFIPEQPWKYLSAEVKLHQGFCEFSDCNPVTGGGTRMRSGRHYKVLSKEQDYKAEWETAIGPSRHFTLLFNIFVYMQLFDMISAKKVNGEFDIFSGFFNNSMWLIVWVGLIIMQFLIVQYGGFVIGCHLEGLTATQWLISIGFGMGSLAVSLFTHIVPIDILPELGIKEVNPLGAEGESLAMQARGRTLSRIATRLQHVRTFVVAKKYAHRARIRTLNRLIGEREAKKQASSTAIVMSD